MATKSKAPNATTAQTQSGDRRELPAGGITAENIEVLEGDIDSRMKALLKDHQEMGGRPKSEPKTGAAPAPTGKAARSYEETLAAFEKTR